MNTEPDPLEEPSASPSASTLDFTSSPRAWLRGALFFALALLPAKLVFFVRWDEYIALDMMYFYAFNLLTRSNILSYGAWPPHDPWLGGGMDLLGHPLSHFFSPFFLVDLLFSPYGAQFVTFLIYGVIGALGMVVWLRDEGFGHGMSAFGAFLFANGSWFTTRFIEGHVYFAQGFYPLPWLVWGARRVDTLRGQLVLGAACTLPLIDASGYAGIFNLFVILTVLALDPAPWKRLLERPRRIATLGVAAVAFLMIYYPKFILMVEFLPKEREVFHFQADYTPDVFFLAFLYPFQHRDLIYERVHYGFHEYACYVGILSVGLLAFALLKPAFRERRGARHLAASLVFLAAGTGSLGPLDPWQLATKMPVFEQFHIQMRLLPIFFTFFVVALVYALARVERVKLRRALCALLVIESIAVSLITTELGFQRHGAERPTAELLETTTRVATLRGIKKPEVYLNDGYAYLRSYEPAEVPTNARYKGQEGYRGEAYPLGCEGTAEITRYTPGRITVTYALSRPCEVQLNTNALAGWTVIAGEASVVEHEDALVTFSPASREGTVELEYTPSYWPNLLIPYVLGVVVVSGLVVLAWRRRDEDVSPFPDEINRP
jgi:hypothetical protein